jgi:hypothetical protein
MKTSMPIAIALVSAAALAQAGAVAAPTASNRKPRTDVVKAPQASGALTWSSNYGAKPGAGDDCSQFNLTVLEPGSGGGAPSGGGIDVGAPGKDLGHFKGHGKIASGSCSYSISGIATDKPITITVGYFGPMGAKADQKRASSDAFTLEKGKTVQKDLKLTLTQVQ